MQVQREKAEEFAHKFGIPYVETSAKEGHNVQQVSLVIDQGSRVISKGFSSYF